MKIHLLKIVVPALIIINSNISSAQTYEVNMSEMIKSKIKPNEIVGIDTAGNVYVSAQRTRPKLIIPLLAVNYYNIKIEKYIKKYDKNLNFVNDLPIITENPLVRQTQIDGKVKVFSMLFFTSVTMRNTDLPAFMIGSKYYTITQDDKTPRNNYYALNVDVNSGEVNNFSHIMALSKSKQGPDLKVEDFKYRFSPDSNLVLFMATYKKTKSKNSGVAYSAAVFTKDMKPVFSSNYTLPKASKTFSIKDAQLTNSGEILILGRSYNKKQKENPGYLSVYSISKEQTKPKEKRVNFKGDYVSDVLLSLNTSNDPLIIGFYKDNRKQKGFEGLYYASLNAEKELYDIKKKEFTKDFIASTYTAKETKKINRKEKRGKEITEDGDFIISDFIQTQDGGYLAIAESYYVQQVTTTHTNSKGMVTRTSVRYDHHYDDIMICKFDKDKNIQTMNKIAKKSVYTSASVDKIYDKDFTYFTSGGETFILFNDWGGSEENVHQKQEFFGSGKATYIVNIKPDGTFKKDVLIKDNQLKEFDFEVHKNLVKLSDNKIAFIATKGGRMYSKKTMMGSVTIHKN